MRDTCAGGGAHALCTRFWPARSVCRAADHKIVEAAQPPEQPGCSGAGRRRRGAGVDVGRRCDGCGGAVGERVEVPCDLIDRRFCRRSLDAMASLNTGAGPAGSRRWRPPRRTNSRGRAGPRLDGRFAAPLFADGVAG